MKAGILVVFGNIDFSSDNKEAIVNEVLSSFVFPGSTGVLTGEDVNDRAERMMDMFNYNSYIIPQYYEGQIIWKK